MPLAASGRFPGAPTRSALGSTLLGFLSWFGSITSIALVFLFSSEKDAPNGSPGDIRAWALLLSILFAEHTYLLVKSIVRYVLSKMDSPGLQKERAERFSMRKQFLEQTFGPDFAEDAPSEALGEGEKVTREALEEEARRASTRGHGSPTEQFVTASTSPFFQAHKANRELGSGSDREEPQRPSRSDGS